MLKAIGAGRRRIINDQQIFACWFSSFMVAGTFILMHSWSNEIGFSPVCWNINGILGECSHERLQEANEGVEGVLLVLQEEERVDEGGGWVGGDGGGEVHFRGSLAWACCPNRAHMVFLSPEHTWFFAQTWHMPNLPWLGKPSILHRKNTVSLLMWGHTDFHEFGFSIVGIVISVSNVTSIWGCQKLSNCPEKSKVSKYCPNCQKL